MVYSNDNGLIVTCNCGCGTSMNFNLSYGIIYVDALESTFSTAQSKMRYRIVDKCKLMWTKFQNKPIYKHGIILTEEEFRDFLDALKKIVSNMEDADEADLNNCSDEEKSAIHVTKMYITDEITEYAIDLRIRLNAKNLLLKEHRAYETYFTKNQLEKFISNIEAKF